MYSPQRERRPWSPDPYDPLPTISRHHVPNESGYDLDLDYSRYPHDNSYSPQRSTQRREPSEVSVEALDLADYARTLQRTQRGHPPDNMLDALHLPSLTYSEASSSRNPRRNHRPFSLPPQSSRGSFHGSPQFLAPNAQEDIDISHFPPWSRGWYNNSNPSTPGDIYSPLPQSQFDSVQWKSKPKHTANPNPFDYDPYSTKSRYGSRNTFNYWNDPPPPTSLSVDNHGSDRNLLPWNENQRSRMSFSEEYPIDPALKEERYRMLEREFGPNAPPQSRNQDPHSLYLYDDEGKPLIGTVSPSGSIVTQGPRKRKFMRALQIIFSAVASIPAIYAAAMIKFKPNEKTPPPAGTPAAYVLYVAGCITLLGLVCLFVFYPCCFGGRKKGPKDATGMRMAGMPMVLPVMQGLKGKNKKGKGGKKWKGKGPPPQDVQVNLIVDPAMFGNRQEELESEEDVDEFSSADSMPGGYGGTKKKKRKNNRRSVFVGLQMEEQWKKARGFLKKITTVDVFGILVWGAVFVFVLIGKRCPTGEYNGWCNAYNASSAAACLLCAAFAVSLFFDIKDLHASKESPRTRT